MSPMFATDSQYAVSFSKYLHNGQPPHTFYTFKSSQGTTLSGRRICLLGVLSARYLKGVFIKVTTGSDEVRLGGTCVLSC